MRPRIFHSDLSGNYYYASRVKDLGGGNYQVQGRKIDVTADIKAILQKEMERYRVELSKKFKLVPK